MKKLLFAFFLTALTALSYAQTYNNEWIDYSKTYYKFKVGADGLYRIPQAALSSAGLGSIAAQDFQLWRNGEEVPVYMSITSGPLNANDYIEFYGLKNDGKLDTKLYQYDSLQMSDKLSLYTDTAAYFLTVNSASANQRMIDNSNDVAGNSLPAEPYFMHKLSKNFTAIMNPGFGYDLGELVHAASYETGEGWTSNGIAPGYPLADNNSNLFLYASGPSAKLAAVVAGNTNTSRNTSIKLNGFNMGSANISAYDIHRFNISGIGLSTFTGGNANLSFLNNGSGVDNVIVSNYELTYPRQFNFGGQSQFYFELPANLDGNYLQIANFNYGSSTPVLYDLTEHLRLTAVVEGGLVKFALPPSELDRQFVLLSTAASAIKTINNFTQRNFIDYSQVVNQGNYVIISHPLLFDDGAGNDNVEKYRQYRSSSAGGSYTAITVNIEQLSDQFSFGIRHHPSAIRNFSAFANAVFSTAPKYFFLIGKGLNYTALRSNQSDPNINKLALVPTFGFPSSDNLLTAKRTNEYPEIPIGRISAITGNEVGIYLDKIKQFELAQQTPSEKIGDKAWMKNFAQITGGLSDPGLSDLINSYMQNYADIAKDTLFGAKVYQFSKNSGSNTAAGTNTTMEDLFNEGMSMLTYFGHSSPNTIEFNLDNPENYNNTGKYPLIIVNGCNSGDLFQFDTLRAVSKGTLSEKFVFANQKGSIGYIASTHFGLPAELNFVNDRFYRNLCNDMYGQSLGNIMKETMRSVFDFYGADYIAQAHVEEITLHGDPAIILNAHEKPDYVIQDSMVSFNPSVISVADSKVTITAKIINIGRSTSDSLMVRMQHQFPDNSIETLFEGKIPAILYEDSITVELPLNPIKNKGLNHIIVTLDPDGAIPELSEANNTASKEFTIIEDEIRPLWPYEYSITADPNVALYGSTANPTAGVKEYVMEMDTTELFNSAFKITRSVTDSGGAIKFVPGIALSDSTVYYWRVAVGPVDNNTRWLNSSFVFINGSDEGYNQSHYFQFRKNEFDDITLDSTSRKFYFNDRTRKILIRTGLYPHYNWDQININVDDDQLDEYGCYYHSLQFVVYDPLTLKPWSNYNSGGSGRFGSRPICTPGTRNFFEFSYNDTAYRRKAIQFFDSIPDGYIVSISNLGYNANTTFIDKWKADTIRLGSGRSLWHKFHELGLTQIDSFTRNLPFLFLFKKGDSTNFPIYQTIGPLETSQIINSYDIAGKQVAGSFTTPWMGPVKAWKDFKWDEADDPSSTTMRYYDIIGKDLAGYEQTLATVYSAKDTNISFIDAALYPSLKLKIYNIDSTNAKTTQLNHWMLTAKEVPEGVLSPNMMIQFQDTLSFNDTLHFKIGFKNISDVPFDSLRVHLNITDKDGNVHVHYLQDGGVKIQPLEGNDSLIITYDIPVAAYSGQNQLMLEVNPDNDQPEMFHFNNLFYRSFLVLGPICPGGNAYFSSGPAVSGNSYQWQVDEGNGYADIAVDNEIYTGTKSNLLSLTAPPTSMFGYKYRCIVTKDAILSNSIEYTLKFALSWRGDIDTDWANPGNWNCGAVPDEHTDVVINPGLVNYPVIVTNASCRSITARPGTTVTVATGNLDIKGPPEP